MQVLVIQDIIAGDAGKGATVDALTRYFKSQTVVRFSGGPQCGHNVQTSDGKHHVFAQFGAGTLAGAKTHLGKDMLIGPRSLLKEYEHLKELGYSNALNNITIDENCVVITPYHVLLNRLIEEKRGENRHGSCGHGLGTARDFYFRGVYLQAKDFFNKETIEDRLDLIEREFEKELQKHGIEPPNTLKFYEDALDFYQNFAKLVKIVPSDYLQEEILNKEETVIFEGNQGVLLDENYGFQPYTTWTDCTFKNALDLLKDYKGGVTKIGCLRTYLTRHGPGPLPTETSELNFPEPHNPFNQWQRNFRQGFLDLVLLRYSLKVVGGVDCLALSHLDCIINKEVKYCESYLDKDNRHLQNGDLVVAKTLNSKALYWLQEKMTEYLKTVQPRYKKLDSCKMIDMLEQELKTNINIKSYGPSAESKVIKL